MRLPAVIKLSIVVTLALAAREMAGFAVTEERHDTG